MDIVHQPVLVAEVIKFLNLQSSDQVIDCTVGSGGHARQLLVQIAPSGKLLGLDRDSYSLALTQSVLQDFNNRIILVRTRFSRLVEVVAQYNFPKAKAVLLDLGWSSDQLADTGRGFSFKANDPLDLRLDNSQTLTAADIINQASEEELVAIFKNYGEINKTKSLVRQIVKIRAQQEIRSTTDLLSIVRAVLGTSRRNIDTAAQVWQALRMAVNNEVEELKVVLPQALQVLKVGGRLAVISFHSGEDRIVKSFFKQEGTNCLCPPRLPVCRCHHRATLKIITAKPITPTKTEAMSNPRARSARLRIVEKI